MPKLSNKKHKRKTTKKPNKKIGAQAALDYLVSWGWILIVIVLALVILFSLGVFKAPTAPTIITGFQGITMQAAEANSTMIVFRITNSYNQFVNITGVTVDVNGNNYTSYGCLNNLISTGQSTLCRVLVSIPTKSYISKIQISFTPYKSSIYEISNGTVSSALLSGSIPINNQLTYFVEKGLPYGSTFTVNYNTSTNSTVVSSTNNKVSFNPPFGNYYFSIPSISYQGCNSIPNPSAGYDSTGVGEFIIFTSNCTTTFSETGLPSGQQWQVTFNGTTASNSTGSKIYIRIKNTAGAQAYYTATAKSDNLECVSYDTPSIALGSSYTFGSWNCTTTFNETGLPSGAKWNVTYAGTTNSSTSDTITFIVSPGSFSYSVPSQFASGSEYIPSPSSGTLSAGLSQSIVFSIMTTFTESGLPSGTKWNVTYDGMENSSTTADITFATSSGSYSYSIAPTSLPVGPAPNNIISGFSIGGSGILGIAYNQANGDVYFADGGSVKVISSSSNTVISTISGFSVLTGIAYNQANGDVYVIDSGYQDVKVINSSSNTVITTVSGTFSNPEGIAYNQANGDIYVANFGSGTLKVINSSSNTVISADTDSGFSNPEGIAYDQANGDIYVTNYGSDTVSIINSSSYVFISTLVTGSNPEGIAYDQANGDIYVTNYGSSTVSVINSFSNKVITNISVGSEPIAVAYDQANGDVYVENYGSDTVNVISSSSNKVISTISVGSNPYAIAYDQANGEIYVGYAGSDYVTVINSKQATLEPVPFSSSSVTAGSIVPITFSQQHLNLTISGFSNPEGIAYDQANGDLYVANIYGSNNVNVISSSSNKVISTISGGSEPDAVAYDQANGDVYVANGGSNNVNVISSSSNKVISTISVGSAPYGVAYDQANGDIYVTNYGSSTVNVISSSSNKVISTISVGSNPYAIAYDQANGEIYVTNYGSSTVSVLT